MLVIVFTVFGYFLAPTLIGELTLLQKGIGGQQTSGIINRIEESITRIIPILEGQNLNLQFQLEAALKNFSDSFFSILLDVVSVLSSVIIIPFLSFFFLKDGRKMKKTLISFVPNRYFEMVLNMFYKVDVQLGGYLRGIFLQAVVVALLAILALWLLNVKYYILIGVFAGLANMIPYVGPVAGASAALGVVIMNNGAPEDLLAVAIAFVIIQLIDNFLLQPLILAKSVDLHPLTIIFAIILGSQFFGIIGMLFAVPTSGIIKVISLEVYSTIKRHALI